MHCGRVDKIECTCNSDEYIKKVNATVKGGVGGNMSAAAPPPRATQSRKPGATSRTRNIRKKVTTEPQTELIEKGSEDGNSENNFLIVCLPRI